MRGAGTFGSASVQSCSPAPLPRRRGAAEHCLLTQARRNPAGCPSARRRHATEWRLFRVHGDWVAACALRKQRVDEGPYDIDTYKTGSGGAVHGR